MTVSATYNDVLAKRQETLDVQDGADPVQPLGTGSSYLPDRRSTTMERYLGIDVHRDSSTICVLSASGKRARRDLVKTNGKALVGYLRQLSGTLHVCIEESTWSEWLYEILSPHVAELVVYQAP